MIIVIHTFSRGYEGLKWVCDTESSLNLNCQKVSKQGKGNNALKVNISNLFYQSITDF